LVGTGTISAAGLGCRGQGLGLRPKAEANLGGGLIGRNGRTTFRPRSRQNLRPQDTISAAGAFACETDVGRFRPVGSGAAGFGLAAAASLAEGLGTDFGRHGRRVWAKFRPAGWQSAKQVRRPGRGPCGRAFHVECTHVLQHRMSSSPAETILKPGVDMDRTAQSSGNKYHASLRQLPRMMCGNYQELCEAVSTSLAE
jgi:hypothetical protein